MLVEPKMIEKIWPKVWKAIGKSVKKFGLEKEDDVKESLISGSRLLCVEGDGMAVFRFGEGEHKYLEINYVGGKNITKWWPQMVETFNRAGQVAGCTKIVSFGRRAWKRIAKDSVETKNIMYTLEIPNA